MMTFQKIFEIDELRFYLKIRCYRVHTCVDKPVLVGSELWNTLQVNIASLFFNAVFTFLFSSPFFILISENLSKVSFVTVKSACYLRFCVDVYKRFIEKTVDGT